MGAEAFSWDEPTAVAQANEPQDINKMNSTRWLPLVLMMA